MIKNLGYSQQLFILPFDHRSTFLKHMLHIEGRPPTPVEVQQIIEMKKIIYDAFQDALHHGVAKEKAAILVDEQFGDQILRDAKQKEFVTILTIEKSGQEEFDFEYGDEFSQHIEKYNPTFAKALVRYNPEGDPSLNKRQRQRLKVLSDYCHIKGYKLLIESLIPPTPFQLERVNGDHKQYDEKVRPRLEIQMMKEFQDGEIEPDVWKIEGMDNKDSYDRLVEQARNNGRTNVGLVVLGRGADPSQVEQWLKTGASVEGVIGFAVGRTVFWDALVAYHNGIIEKEEVISTISKNYQNYCNIFMKKYP